MKLTELDPNAPPPIPLPEPGDDPAKEFLSAARSGRNVFLSGMAGTGKSTLLRKLLSEPDERGWYPDADITAPTGIAALNIGGMTIHRWSGMLLGPGSDQRDLNETNEAYYLWLSQQPYRSIRRGWERIRSCKCLVIDEISMLAGRQFTFLEWLFRKVRKDDRPWGGCQVIVIGDFLQLAPVRKNQDLPYDWNFNTEAWERSEFASIMLTRIHRQNEVDFIAALCAVRENRIVGRPAFTLQKRIIPFPAADIPRLFTHNAQVDKWNESMLAGLETEERKFEGTITGDERNGQFLADNLICPQLLCLKEGARVMCTVNDPEGQYVNGSMGTVVEFTPYGIDIDLDRGHRITVARYKWKYGKEFEQGYATYSQYPLRLAYALTIHKCQGLTLDRAYIDVRAAREPGQTYVALSRVRTLEGLMLKDWFTTCTCSTEALRFYESIRKKANA